MGEAAPLSGLSIDFRADFEEETADLCNQLTGLEISHGLDLMELADDFVSDDFPSLRFALETALLDRKNGGKRIIFQNGFSNGTQPITINGLIWMNNPAEMQKQIEEKLAQGFHCLKLKIGAVNFEQELALLRNIRQKFDAQEISLRVDANGAFSPQDALDKLKLLADLDIHSIEQPIRAGQEALSARLCAATPIPIALDEELIGKMTDYARRDLLETIRPQFIILKPSLLGGFEACRVWIRLAQELNIGWWMTSALESNIGLNAIAQFTAEFDNSLPQGLGTGELYHNNINSPLEISGEKLRYQPTRAWAVPQ
jgi:o-succinylbenzoate synthase